MRFRQLSGDRDISVDLPIANAGTLVAVRLWQSDDEKFHIGLEFGDGNRLALLEAVEGTTEEDAMRIGADMRNWIARIRVVDDYGKAV